MLRLFLLLHFKFKKQDPADHQRKADILRQAEGRFFSSKPAKCINDGGNE